MTLELLQVHRNTGDNIQHGASYFLRQVKHESHVLRVKDSLFFVVLIHSNQPHSTKKKSRCSYNGRSEVVSLSERVEGMKKPYK